MPGHFPRPLTNIKVSVEGVPSSTGTRDRVGNPRLVSSAFSTALVPTDATEQFTGNDFFYGKVATFTLPTEFLHYLNISKGLTTIREPIRVLPMDVSFTLEEPDPRWWGLIGSVVTLRFYYTFGTPTQIGQGEQKRVIHEMAVAVMPPDGGEFPRTIEEPHQITVNGDVRVWKVAADEGGLSEPATAYLSLDYAADEYYIGGTRFFADPSLITV